MFADLIVSDSLEIYWIVFYDAIIVDRWSKRCILAKGDLTILDIVRSYLMQNRHEVLQKLIN